MGEHVDPTELAPVQRRRATEAFGSEIVDAQEQQARQRSSARARQQLELLEGLEAELDEYSRQHRRVPRYAFLTAAAWLFLASAVLVLIQGVAHAIGGLDHTTAPQASASGGALELVRSVDLAEEARWTTAAGLLFAGLFIGALAQGVAVLRDVARDTRATALHAALERLVREHSR